MHAVIVDSSRVVLKLVAQHFADRGDAVSTFVDSREALAKIRADSSVDILMTSLEVTPLSGLELCWESRLLATRHRPLYIAVMSSDNDTGNIAQVLDCGADDLIPKPVSKQQLYARLRTVSRLHTAQLELVRLAETDALTGVLNRRAFFEKFEPLLQHPEDVAPLCTIMLDIDHFKRVNDLYGHQAGDQVIQAVAGKASNIGGIIGRLGGEEFAVVLPHATAKDAVDAANKFRKDCGTLVFHSGKQSFQVTCSLGVSTFLEGDTTDSLLRRADIALYAAKTGGRDQVREATPQCGEIPETARGVTRRSV